MFNITSLSSVLYGWVLEVATPRPAIGSVLWWGHLNCLKAESWRTPRDIAGQEGPECLVWACKQVLAVIGVSQWAGILLWQGIFWGKTSAASLLPVHEPFTFLLPWKCCIYLKLNYFMMFVRVDIMQWLFLNFSFIYNCLEIVFSNFPIFANYALKMFWQAI